MNMHWIDWTIVIILLVLLLIITVYSKRYTKSVADFLAANRLAGRYLLTVSSGFGGAIIIISHWQIIYDAGLPTQWWTMMGLPVGLFLSLTGFVIYRFRQTRALTMAQFFEMRYSRRFRVFAGSLSWLAGILLYGIFPAVTSHFILYFFGLPEVIELGWCSIPVFPLIMLIYLSIACYTACIGVQISVMLTDFFQGMLLMLIFLIIMFFLLAKFQWTDIIAGLQIAPAGKSMLNPFNTSEVDTFSIWFFLIGLFGTIYNTRAWQSNSGYNASAKTPHEAVMAGIISSWRIFASGLCMNLIPLAAYAVFHLPAFAAMAAPIHADLGRIADPVIRGQMLVPLFLAHLLPIGLMGLFAAIIVAGAISCDNTYIHSWGTIFIQDVLMPLRRKPLDQKTHLLWLRCSICGIALFGFVFSLLFPLKDFIIMYFALTGSIYLGGAGSVILGGLYWKRGTTEAAWTALITGTVLAFGGMVIQQIWSPWLVPAMQQIWPDLQWMAAHKTKFPVNGQIIAFIAMVSALSSYILVSLLGPQRIHNMDKLLHCGQYAVKTDIAEGDMPETVTPSPRTRMTLSSLIGITPQFTRFDRFIAKSTFYWSMGWWGIFLIGTGLGLFTNCLTDAGWAIFWWWKLVAFSVILGIVCTIWIFWGGIRDVYRLFRDLKAERIDEEDDGTVKKDI